MDTILSNHRRDHLRQRAPRSPDNQCAPRRAAKQGAPRGPAALGLRAALLIVVFGGCGAVFGQAPEELVSATPQIVQPIDEGKLIQLTGNTHPLARPEFDEGAVAPSMPMDRILMVLRRSPEREAALEQFMKEQLDPASPNFHVWLSPEEFGSQYGPAEVDIQKITSWLASHGFTVNRVSNGRTLIDFSGTAAQVSEAFHTEIHRYQVGGEEHTANASDLEIPEALGPVIAGIFSLHDFYSKPLHTLGALMRQSAATGKWTPANETSPQFFIDVHGENYEMITPYDFATIYNVLPLWNAASPIDGTGQNVAIAGRSDVVLSDVATFRSDFGLPVNAPTVIVNGPDPGVPTENDQIENTLDIEWSGAVAKGATIDFVTSKNTSNTGGDFLSDVYIVDNDVAPVMSSSYGSCELDNGTGGNTAINSLWQQAATEGIAVFIAAGDEGSAGCDSDTQTPPDSATKGLQVNGLASTPYDIAVGGTDFDYVGDAATYWNSTNSPTTDASAKGYIPEIPWNSTCTNPVVDTILGFGGEETTCNYIKTHSVDTYLLTIGGGSGGESLCTTPSGSTPPTCSGGYAKPSWQIGTGVPTDGQRDLPDVSLFAGNAVLGSAYLICVTSASPDGTCSFNNANDVLALSVGGTSVSSPAMAGVMALVNQRMGSPQGDPNAVFYQLAALDTLSNCNASTVGNGSACNFYDTTSGTNAMPCTTGSQNCTTATGGDTIGVLSGYTATTGYDLTTGLGSANVANLVDDWIAVVTTTPVATTLAYNGPTTLTDGSAANLSAVLKQTTSGNPVAGASVTFTLGSGGAAQSCSGTTSSNGTASCSITDVNQSVGASSITAVFAGNPSYLSSTSGPVVVTIVSASAVGTTLAYNGPTTFTDGGAANLSAVLTQTMGGNPVVGASVLFTLGSGGTAQTCSGTTSSNGAAACAITSVNQNVGADTVSASFAGNANYLASSAGPVTVTIAAAATTLAYNGPTTFTSSNAANLSAVLTQTTGGNAVAGASVLFTLGSGGAAQTCSGATSSSGTATCSIASVNQTPGAHTVSASFAGNSSFLASSAGPVTITVVDFSVSNSTGPQTIVAGQSATFTIATAALGGNSTIVVSFAASGLPTEASATFSPASVTPGTSTAMMVTTTARPGGAAWILFALRGPRLRRTSPRLLPGSFAAWLASLAFAILLAGMGFAGFGWRPLARLVPVTALILLIGTAGYLAGCAGSASGVGVQAPAGTPAGTYTITVTGTSGNDAHSASATLTVQ